jgi:hypothetical protein
MLAAVRLPRKIDIVHWRERAWRFAQSERGRDTLCLAFILALVSVMLRRCLVGDPPIGHDHPVHLVRIWQFGHTLLHHPLAPWRWSHLWFAGYPQNVVYPIGADLFVLTIKALSLNLLSLTSAYALAFFLFYFFYGASTYLFVRHAVQSRIAAVLAAVFLLTDRGSNDTGGWFWIVDVGVWTSAFGMAPVLIALLLINGLFDKIDNRRVVAAALCLGFAFLCHPLHLIFAALAVPLLCLSRYLNGEPTCWRKSFLALALIIGIAACIASYWFVPYFPTSSYVIPTHWNNPSLQEIGQGFAAARFFDRMNPFAATLGFVGMLALLAARQTLALFMSIFVFVALTLGSSTFAGLLGAGVEEWAQKHIIVARFLMLAKPFWYGAAGFGIVAVARGVQSLGQRGGRTHLGLRVDFRLIITVLLAGPIALYFFASFIGLEVKQPATWLSDRKDNLARQEFIDWAHSWLDRQDGFFRIAHGFQYNDHGLADLAIALPYPFYEVQQTPTGHFNYDIHGSSNGALRATNVRFLLSRAPLPQREDVTLRKIFRESLFLYEFRDWNPQPFEIDGSGTVDVVSWTNDDIVLRAAPDAQGTLRLNVSIYPKWHATLNDAPLPITPAEAPGAPHSAFMTVPLRPGTIRFQFRQGAIDYIGTVAALIGLTTCVALLKSSRVERWLKMSI